MRSLSSWWVGLAASGAVLLSSPLVAAAEPAGTITVQLRGTEPGMTFAVARPRERALGPRCSDPCQLTAPNGKYELHVFRGDAALGTTSLRVSGPAFFQVSPPNLSRQRAGLTLGITGSAFLLAGFVAVTYAITARHDCGLDETCRNRYVDTLWYGTGAVALGTVLSPIGWVLFGTNRSPKVRLVPEPRRARDGSLSVALTF